MSYRYRFVGLLLIMIIICATGFWLRAVESAMTAVMFPEKVGEWSLEGKEELYDRESLFDYMDGAAELYLAYGFRSLRVARYSRGAGAWIIAELYEMDSAEDAFGVFSFEREDKDVGVGQGSELGGGILRFWKGRYFASLYGGADGLEGEILGLGRALAQRIQEQGNLPEILGFLPESGLEKGSIRFFRNHVVLNQRFFLANKNILQLGPDTEGVLARLRGTRSRVHLVLVRYPTEQRAISAEESFAGTYMPDSPRMGKVRTEDGKWTGALRIGKTWIGVFGAESEDELDSVLKVLAQRMESR